VRLRIVIIGCGRTGSTLGLLLAAEGHNVAVIDRRRDAFRRLGKSHKVDTVVGNGLDEDILRKAGIESADAVVACTAGDNTNIMAAQVARETFNVPRVGLKVNDPIRGTEYRAMGFFALTECAFLGGVFHDWILEQEFRPVLDYHRTVPIPK
jgi:trk system potassium uptake protein TrkA